MVGNTIIALEALLISFSSKASTEIYHNSYQTTLILLRLVLFLIPSRPLIQDQHLVGTFSSISVSLNQKLVENTEEAQIFLL